MKREMKREEEKNHSNQSMDLVVIFRVAFFQASIRVVGVYANGLNQNRITI